MSTSTTGRTAAPKRLTAKQAQALKPETGTAPKLYAIAPNLYLQNTPTGSKSFLFIGSLNNEKVRTGLGSWDIDGTEIATQARMWRTWSEAVARAIELKEAASQGIDPREAEKAWRATYLKSTPADVAAEAREAEDGPLKPGDPGRGHRRSFRAAAKEFLKANPKGWSLDEHLPERAKHDGGLNSYTGRRWLESLVLHAYPKIGDKFVHELNHKDVLACVQEKWISNHSLAWRVRQRIENIIDWSIAMEYRVTPNPARFDGKLAQLLESHETLASFATHVPAFEHDKIPGFWSALGERPGIDAQCLRWVVLTLVRSEAARGADWKEIDYLRRTWSVPPSRMKGKKLNARRAAELEAKNHTAKAKQLAAPHMVPLSDAAWRFLESLPGFGSKSGLMFANRGIGRGKVHKPLSRNAMYALMQRMGYQGVASPHGMRASFRGWATKCKVDYLVAEAVLAHVVENRTQLAYNRPDHHNHYFEPRIDVMQAWGEYVTGAPAGNVMPLTAAA